MTSRDSTSRATEEASVRSGAEMADEISRMFGALDVVLPKEVVCSWSLENMVSAEEMSDFMKLLEKACSLVGERRMAMLRKMSRIPQVSLKTFSNFDTDRLSPNNRDVIEHLESLDFIGIGENVVIVGDQGTGKTHIAQAIGNRCCDSLFSAVRRRRTCSSRSSTGATTKERSPQYSQATRSPLNGRTYSTTSNLPNVYWTG